LKENLEIKFPIIWTDKKQNREKTERRKNREKRKK